MAGFNPADDTSRRRILAPCVPGRSRDRRHSHDWTGTRAGWRSAQREIAPAQLAGRRPPFVPMFCVPGGGMKLRPCRRRCRQRDAGAGERQRTTDSARTGLFCAAQPRRTRHRQAAHSRQGSGAAGPARRLTLRDRAQDFAGMPIRAHGRLLSHGGAGDRTDNDDLGAAGCAGTLRRDVGSRRHLAACPAAHRVGAAAA
jgi:hypothetical protein